VTGEIRENPVILQMIVGGAIELTAANRSPTVPDFSIAMKPESLERSQFHPKA
jgi:hypothetical protein